MEMETVTHVLHYTALRHTSNQFYNSVNLNQQIKSRMDSPLWHVIMRDSHLQRVYGPTLMAMDISWTSKEMITITYWNIKFFIINFVYYYYLFVCCLKMGLPLKMFTFQIWVLMLSCFGHVSCVLNASGQFKKNLFNELQQVPLLPWSPQLVYPETWHSWMYQHSWSELWWVLVHPLSIQSISYTAL